jgi:hypothetical protein
LPKPAFALPNRCPPEAVVDGEPKPGFGNRRDGDHLRAALVELSDRSEQPRCGLDEIAATAEVQ